MELVAARTRADFTVSGHMGAPTCMVWNSFAISSIDEATRRVREGLEEVRRACLGGSPNETRWAEKALSLIGRLPEDTVYIGRQSRALRWYRGMTHINLPDAHVGYAVMDVEETSTAIQTRLVSGAHSGDVCVPREVID